MRSRLGVIAEFSQFSEPNLEQARLRADCQYMNIDELKSEFFTVFGKPVDHLGPPAGKYNWTHTEWSTSDAIRKSFPGLDNTLRSRLVDELDPISRNWLLLEDITH
jgi:hypothetical protein